MTVKIEQWSNYKLYTIHNWYINDELFLYKNHPTDEFNPKEEIFKRFDKANNKLRYCNGSHYKFVDENLHREYIEWYDSLSKSEKLDMYYGNGIVD